MCWPVWTTGWNNGLLSSPYLFKGAAVWLSFCELSFTLFSFTSPLLLGQFLAIWPNWKHVQQVISFLYFLGEGSVRWNSPRIELILDLRLPSWAICPLTGWCIIHLSFQVSPSRRPPSMPSVRISLIYPALCMFRVHHIGWIITPAQFIIPRGSKPTENSHKTIQHFLHFLINPLPLAVLGIIEKMNRSRRGRQFICNDPAGQCCNQYSGWLRYNHRHPTVSVAKFCFVRVFLVGQRYCEQYTVWLWKYSKIPNTFSAWD